MYQASTMAFHMLAHLILTGVLQSTMLYFRDEETKAATSYI